MSTQPIQLSQFNLGARVSWSENGEHEGLYIGPDPYFPGYVRVDPFDSSLLRDGEKSVMVHSSQLRPPSPARPQARVLEFKTPEPKPAQPKTEQPDPAPMSEPLNATVPEPEQQPKQPAQPPSQPAEPSPSDLRLEMALRMANLGIPLIRLHPRGKLPIDNGWQNRATTDPNTIRSWFKADPDTNYACVAKPDLFLFLEIDQSGVVERYEAETGNKMPPTFTVQSSPGKFHRYFRQTDKSRACGQIKQGPGGISFGSLRQNNAYVVGALSIHPDTGLPYTVVDESPIVPIPDALIDWLDAQRASKPAANIEKGEASMPAEDSGLRIEIDPGLEILSGSRDNTLASIAGGLRFHSDNTLSFNELENTLERVNNEHCVPPIDDPERIAKSYSQKSYASIREKQGVVIGGKFLDSREGTILVGLRVTKDAKVEEIREIDPTVAKPPGQTTADIAAANAAAAAETLWNNPSPDPTARLVEVQKFELDFLPASIRPRVVDVAKHTATPLDFSGVAAILCLAGVTGRRVFVHPMAHSKEWTETVALSGFIVAASGETKTPVWNAFLAPAIELDSMWRQKYKDAKARYEEELNEWEQSKKRKKGDQLEIKPKPKEPPKQRRCVINNATPEALHSAMEDNPEGYLYHRDELSGFVEELDQEGRESQRDIFMKAMDGNSCYTMTRIGRGEISAIMCAGVSGNFQPNRLTALLNNTRNIEDGYVPRNILMVYPKIERRKVVDCPTDLKAKEVYRYIMQEIAVMHAGKIEMHFTPEAQGVFIRWLEEITERADDETSDWIKSHLNKYKGAVPKLAGLFQLIDIIAAEGAASGYGTGISPVWKRRKEAELDDALGVRIIGEEHLIDLDHLNQALRLLGYLESHMRKIYATVASPLAKAEAALASHIKDGSLESGFMVRDIVRKGWRNLKEQAFICEAIQTLEDAGWLRQVAAVRNGAGRPGKAWEINPKVKSPQKG